MIVSIDPGVTRNGVAWWDDEGRLIHAFLMDTDYILAPGALFPDATELAIEIPQVYDRSKSKGDPNDLIALAFTVGCICTRFGRVHTLYKPRVWKGSVPKDVMIERIQGRLSALEKETIDLPARSLQHNVWDAIGIGLHHLRAKRRDF